MGNIQITARFLIHDGKFEEFKTLAKACMDSVRTKDKNTRQYDWYFSPDQKECVVRETYPDSNGILEHMVNLGDLLGRIMEISDFYPELYGSPSKELLEAAAPLNPKVYSFYQGI